MAIKSILTKKEKEKLEYPKLVQHTEYNVVYLQSIPAKGDYAKLIVLHDPKKSYGKHVNIGSTLEINNEYLRPFTGELTLKNE